MSKSLTSLARTGILNLRLCAFTCSKFVCPRVGMLGVDSFELIEEMLMSLLELDADDEDEDMVQRSGESNLICFQKFRTFLIRQYIMIGTFKCKLC